MGVYNTGSVRIRTGSASIRGNNTDFLTYVSAGDLFKRIDEAAIYDVAAVVNATNLTLSSRYTNSVDRTSRTDEHIATANTATKRYSGTLDFNPVIQNYVILNASIETFVDDGAGVLTGDGTPAGSGSIDYDTSAWSITLGTDLTATAAFTASYFSGDTLNSMEYQIVVDFTPNKLLPEMSTSDTNFAHIYTKAMRLIDKKLEYAINTSASITKLKADNFRRPITSKSSSYAATPTDGIILVGGSVTATVVITVPYASSGNKGCIMSIINNATPHSVLASCYSGNTINASGYIVLGNIYDKVNLVCATPNLWIKI